MDMPSNPLAVLTFLSTPAVLTNASCVLLFGTGNRYGRAIDRVHELAETLRSMDGTNSPEKLLRAHQLRAGERRAALIVRALTCFYAAVAAFITSTLLCLLATVTRPSVSGTLSSPMLLAALVAGLLGGICVVTGASMLVRESWYSFRILAEERTYLDSLPSTR